jgi:hypothetical protein
MRELFPDRTRFIFGDHELGKYDTNTRKGGIRIESLYRGEQQLGIRSFWNEEMDGFRLIGINSSLFTLDLFLPEALEEEIPAWREHRERHMNEVIQAFEKLEPTARVLLFCHDPSALSVVAELPEVKARIGRIERTVLGHLHAPALLKLAQLLPHVPRWNPKYPVARIVAKGLRGVKSWAAFNPIVCPSTFGAGHHLTGGILFLEASGNGPLITKRHRVRI